jgi:hypothetical protein
MANARNSIQIGCYFDIFHLLVGNAIVLLLMLSPILLIGGGKNWIKFEKLPLVRS